jgi:hypothetical protein
MCSFIEDSLELPLVRAVSHPAILANKHLPVVCCGRIDALPLHTVQPDVAQIVRIAWAKILAAGYKRIGAALTMHTPPVEDDFDRFGTVLALQNETLGDADLVPVLRSPIHDAVSLVEWFRKYEPDCVLGFGTENYFHLRDAVAHFERVGFCSLHAQNEQHGDVVISGVREEEEANAYETVNLLDTLIRHRSVGTPEKPMRILLQGHWIEGNTLKPRNSPPGD